MYIRYKIKYFSIHMKIFLQNKQFVICSGSIFWRFHYDQRELCLCNMSGYRIFVAFYGFFEWFLVKSIHKGILKHFQIEGLCVSIQFPSFFMLYFYVERLRFEGKRMASLVSIINRWTGTRTSFRLIKPYKLTWNTLG